MSRRRHRPQRKWNVPNGPVDMDEVFYRFPKVRQSFLATFDDCHLSALFNTRYDKGYSTVPQAAGQLFHRFAAECLRWMQRQDSEHLPVAVALGILEHVLEQDDVEPRDIVALPLREIPMLEMVCRKFAKDNAFTIRRVQDVERRFDGDLRYQAPNGEWVTRVLTGQLDALLFDPPDGATVLDWKNTWALPPERDMDAESPGVSYHGYFQQLFYAWLIFKNFSAVNFVTLREFYVRRTKVRPARVSRGELPKIEEKLARLVRTFDRSVMAGAPVRLTVEDVEDHGYWKPSPGQHCFFCSAPRLCPLSEEETGLPPSVLTEEDAMRLAGERQVAKAIIRKTDESLRGWADARGPIPLKSAKGRRVLGHRQLANGKTRFEEYTPEEADRPPTRTSQTPNLEDAMRKAAEKMKEGAS